MRRAIALLVTAGLHALAQAPPPADLRALLVPLRAHAKEHEDTRGATPVLTQVKRVLRDWVESRLPSLAPWDDGAALSHQLNTELQQAGVACGGEAECPDQTLLGFLGDITIRRSGELLVVQTTVGIQCGLDESAYAYEPVASHWRRFWESEQSNYTKKGYQPQYFRAVLISPTDLQPEADKSEHLVLTLGSYPWCSSNWQGVYYRVWQTKSAYPQPKLLLDGSEIAYQSEPIQGSVWPKDVLIEYAVASIDAGVHNRRQIRHYVLTGGKLEQIDPVVLSPRDFADWWLTGHWADVSHWTNPTAKAALESWHRKLKGFHEFIDPTRHCTTRPDLWQVGIQKEDEDNSPEAYFLIRWRPPYHFTMVDIAAKPWPDCTEDDREADQFRTLFPTGDWHGD